MEMITSNRGCPKLCYEGHSYTKNGTNKTTLRWECSQRRTRSCKGAVVTDLQVENVLRVTNHSHDADVASVQANKLKENLKAKAATTRGTPGQLISDTTLFTTVDVRAALGNTDALKRTLRRQKAKHHPKNPSSTANLTIDDDCTTTGGDNPRPFLFYDNGADSRSRMLVFGSDTALQHLAKADIWMMDGTFDVAPHIFAQLYVIRAPLDDGSVSCVYALLSDKSEATYQELLTTVIDHCEELGHQPDPTSIITDFEKAAINAVSITLGDHVHTQGCFYHLTQATWRKIQNLGLTTLFRSNKDVRHFVGMLDGLAFLPLDDVPEGMLYLRDNIPAGVEPLVDYFDQTYVTGSFRRIQQPPSNDGIV
ncbi:uncharacterized protein LOC121386019 [Gigantopelta aegis]|uniref:uncharacterized protein LOC121386019 n=1 Tax=Gigantopelta aegis TaxID=1735272 RepID=UPI001B88A1FA|nr:uncharacterized protein LOC121386019 [Gigantopelta aegis]